MCHAGGLCQSDRTIVGWRSEDRTSDRWPCLWRRYGRAGYADRDCLMFRVSEPRSRGMKIRVCRGADSAGRPPQRERDRAVVSEELLMRRTWTIIGVGDVAASVT